VRTPAGLPRMQHDTVVRLLAADLAPPEAVLEGLAGLESEIDEAAEALAVARQRWAQLTRRAPLLEVNDRYAQRLLELQREWLADARRALTKGE
jgi:hypothetical protein